MSALGCHARAAVRPRASLEPDGWNSACRRGSASGSPPGRRPKGATSALRCLFLGISSGSPACQRRRRRRGARNAIGPFGRKWSLSLIGPLQQSRFIIVQRPRHFVARISISLRRASHQCAAFRPATLVVIGRGCRRKQNKQNGSDARRGAIQPARAPLRRRDRPAAAPAWRFARSSASVGGRRADTRRRDTSAPVELPHSCRRARPSTLTVGAGRSTGRAGHLFAPRSLIQRRSAAA